MKISAFSIGPIRFRAKGLWNQNSVDQKSHPSNGPSRTLAYTLCAPVLLGSKKIFNDKIEKKT